MAFGNDLDAWQGGNEAGGQGPLALIEKKNARSFLGLSWGELKLLTLAGVGFFLDAYDLFIINMVSASVQQGESDFRAETLFQSLTSFSLFASSTSFLLFFLLFRFSVSFSLPFPQIYAILLVAYSRDFPPGGKSIGWGLDGGMLKASANVGNIVGQVGFGLLGDTFGRWVLAQKGGKKQIVLALRRFSQNAQSPSAPSLEC